MLPGVAAVRCLPFADKLNAGLAQLVDGGIDVVDEQPRDHLVVRELLSWIGSIRTEDLDLVELGRVRTVHLTLEFAMVCTAVRGR